MTRPQRRASEVLTGFFASSMLAAIVAACSVVASDGEASESELALVGGVAMLPSSDVAKLNVSATGDTTSYFRNIDDGASFSVADDDTTVVRNTWAASTASYTAGFSGGPTGTIGDVEVSYRVRATSGALGTVRVTLLSGTTVIASGAPRNVTSSYQNVTERFSGLSVASASSLRVQVDFVRSNAEGYLKLTQMWLVAAPSSTSTDGGVVAPSDATSDAMTDATVTSDASVGTGSGTADEIHFTYLSPNAVTFDWRGSAKEIRVGTTTSYTSKVLAKTPSPLPYSSSGPFWEARVDGLTPGTLYHYAIGAGADRTFRTPPAIGTSDFRVIVEGDIGDTTSYSRVGIVQQQIADKKPAFVLGVGDLTYANAHGQAHVDQHFNDVMKWSQEAAYMPIWGNHEWDKSTDDLRNYKGRFELPNARASAGAPSLGGPGEDWYWFDYGNVRFIAFPEPYTSASWSEWETAAAKVMDEAQTLSAIDFIVTMGHRPAFSSGHHSGSSTLQNIHARLAANHPKYVLDLSGHSHDYERTTPQAGVVHITAGGGGATLEQDGSCLWLTCTKPSWSAFRAMRLGAVMLDFSQTKIVGTAICGPAGGGTNDVSCVEGSAMDTFEVVPR
jgi:hypothetical protein